MTKKKIIFFLPLLTIGGAERVSINILNKLDRKQYEIHLVLGTMKGDAIHILPKNIEIHDLNSNKTIYSILKLRKKIKEISPFAIFSSLNRAHIALYLSLIGIRKQPKIIMRVPSSPKLVHKYNEMGKLFKFFLNLSFKSANRLIAQTPEMKEEIEKYHNIPQEKIKILINPLDTELIDSKINERCTEFQPKYFNVVASGRLTVEKGYDTLIKAFAEVHKKNNKFRLFIIGPDYGNELKKYQAMMHELKLNDIITFLGFQKNPYKYYQNSDLFVLSSRREGLPNTVLENLYLKKPVVGTRCISFMEILIKDGENGFLVDVDDIEQLSSAILNFQKININYKTIEFNTQSVNDIFTFQNK